jgi:hypothetical protein
MVEIGRSDGNIDDILRSLAKTFQPLLPFPALIVVAGFEKRRMNVDGEIERPSIAGCDVRGFVARNACRLANLVDEFSNLPARGSLFVVRVAS